MLLWYLTCMMVLNKLIKAKAISPLKLFSGNKTYFRSHWSCSIKKQSLKLLEFEKENLLESFFNKVAGPEDCHKTYLLHSHLRFYFSLGKTLKKNHQICINYMFF